MIHNNIEFFNVASLERKEGINGLILQRFPENVRHALGSPIYKKGRFKAQVSSGCEIRFVTDSSAVRIVLTALETDGDICVYIGDHFHSIHHLTACIAKPIFVDLPDQFLNLREETEGKGRFSSKLWRFVIGRGVGAMDIFSVALQYVDTFGHETRPPIKDEAPAVHWLAYGSSITHGSGATVNHNSYIQQAARRMGVDVLNKGIGGSCHCEPEVADYIASEEWDFITLEIGVNMRGKFTPEEFEERARYLIKRALESHPGKPVFLITIYPNSADYIKNNGKESGESNRKFKEILRKLHKEWNNSHLYLIEGDTVLTDFGALTFDLTHPSDYGHILMGQNLAEKIRPVLVRYGLVH